MAILLRSPGLRRSTEKRRDENSTLAKKNLELRRKFSIVSGHYQKHVTQANESQIHEWSENLIDARNLDEAFQSCSINPFDFLKLFYAGFFDLLKAA